MTEWLAACDPVGIRSAQRAVAWEGRGVSGVATIEESPNLAVIGVIRGIYNGVIRAKGAKVR